MSTDLPKQGVPGKKQIKFRLREDLADELDRFVEESERFDYRSDLFRDAAKRALDTDMNDYETPYQPPANEQLRTVYCTLCELSNPDGLVNHRIAVEELCRELGKSQTAIQRNYLSELEERGYIKHKTNYTGTHRSWLLRGKND